MLPGAVEPARISAAAPAKAEVLDVCSGAAAVEPTWSRLHSRSMPLGDDALTTT